MVQTHYQFNPATGEGRTVTRTDVPQEDTPEEKVYFEVRQLSDNEGDFTVELYSRLDVWIVDSILELLSRSSSA